MGNLTRDPELRQTPNGRSVCSFGVATNRRWNDQAGERQEQVEFHDVVAWGKLAEICGQILYKGRKAYIEGRLQTHSWEGQDGVKRSKTEIIADNVIAVGAPREGGGPGASAAPAEDFDQRPAEEKDEKLSEAKSASGGVDKVDKVSKDDSKKSEPEKKSATKNPPAGGDDEEEIDLDDIPF